jgi:hypothetical protein
MKHLELLFAGRAPIGPEADPMHRKIARWLAHDAVNYVLPVQLKDAEDRVEEGLKLQRLNVGLSRAQECIHFVLSKPIEQFSGSARTALQHFKCILDDKSKGEPGDTDPRSPMEANLLGWLKATPPAGGQTHRSMSANSPVADGLEASSSKASPTGRNLGNMGGNTYER